MSPQTLCPVFLSHTPTPLIQKSASEGVVVVVVVIDHDDDDEDDDIKIGNLLHGDLHTPPLPNFSLAQPPSPLFNIRFVELLLLLLLLLLIMMRMRMLISK